MSKVEADIADTICAALLSSVAWREILKGEGYRAGGRAVDLGGPSVYQGGKV